MKYKHPLAYYAGIYNRELSSIKRYSRTNAPLDDPEAMKVFLANKKDTGRAGKKAGRAKKAPSLPEPIVDPKNLPGAQHALARMAEEEVQARGRLNAAKATKDPEQLKLATELYIKFAESLLRYDRQVDVARRDAGEIITRAQGMAMLTAMTVWLRRGIEGFLNSICLQIVDAEKPEEVYALIAPMIRQSVGNAVDAATGDGKLPGWVREAMVSGL